MARSTPVGLSHDILLEESLKIIIGVVILHSVSECFFDPMLYVDDLAGT